VTDRLLTRPFVFAWLANMAQGMAFTMFLHFPGFLKGLGAGEVEIGLIVGLTAVASIAVRPTVGRAMDRRGRRPVILFGNIVNVAVLALYLTVGELGIWLYAVRITHGFAEALLFTALFTYGADQVPATRRTEGIALFGISGILPIALGGVLGDIILARWDFDVFFVFVLGFGILSLLLSLPLPESSPTGADGEEQKRFLASVLQKNLVPLWWVTLVFSLALTAYFTFLKTFVIDTGIGSVGLFFSTYAATAIGLRLFAAWLPDRVGPKRVLYPALGSMVLGFVVLASATGSGAIAVAGVLCGAGHGYAFPIVMGMVVSRAAEADRGSAMAIFTGLFDVGALLGGPAFGAIIRFGSYSSMFLAAGGWMLVGGLIYAYLDRSNPVAPTGERRTRLGGTSMIPGESAAVLIDSDPPTTDN
jgi:MFS family permease